MNPRRDLVILLVLALVPALIAAVFHPRRPSWNSREVSLSGLPDQVLWIDARPAAEFALDHIPGAFSLNEDAWESGLEPVLDAWSPGQTVVVYCSSAGCRASQEVADRLRQKVGLDDVRVFTGGWEAWLQSRR